MQKKILIVVGTRPEAIKMAPVILGLKNQKWAEVCIVATAQHRKLLDQVFNVFKIRADIDLNIMQKNQSLSKLTSRLFDKFDKMLSKKKPDIVLAQGDTTTALVANIVCFYKNICFGHIEAGLRTWDIKNPFPEEMNRQFISKTAKLHFATTKLAKQNLIKENIDPKKIFITGNTVIDALLLILKKTKKINFSKIKPKEKIILVTCHRRENFKKPIINICKALKSIALNNKDIKIIFSVHPNPNVKKIVFKTLKKIKNIILSKPLTYEKFIHIMKMSYLIITDSGGIQEEAPSFGIPVLIIRTKTERPEAINAGVSKIIGTGTNNIVKITNRLLKNEKYYKKIAKISYPYGRGNSAKKIINIIKKFNLNKNY